MIILMLKTNKESSRKRRKKILFYLELIKMIFYTVLKTFYKRNCVPFVTIVLTKRSLQYILHSANCEQQRFPSTRKMSLPSYTVNNIALIVQTLCNIISLQQNFTIKILSPHGEFKKINTKSMNRLRIKNYFRI